VAAAKSTPKGNDPQIRHEAAAPPLAAASLYAVSAAATYLRQPAAVIAVCLVAAVVGGTIGALTRRSIWMLVYTAVAVAVAAAWLVYTQAASPFTKPAGVSLALALSALWPTYWLAHHLDRRERRGSYQLAKDAAGRAGRKGDWPGLLAEFGCPGVTVEETRVWRAGYTKVLRLPAYKGMTVKRIAGLLEQLEVALDVPEGRVRVERGPTASVALVHVTTRDVLAEIVPIPRDTAPRSINDPFDIALTETGEKLEILLREVHARVIGTTGEGKSVLLNVLIARLIFCVDTVVWVIDKKGGRTARPWLEPWLRGESDRPVLDWVATTDAEAALMLQAALAAIDHRAHSGAGGSKIIPSAHQPQIVVIGEEVSALIGMHAETSGKYTKLLTMLAQTGRSEAVAAVLLAQRSTVTMGGSGDLSSLCKLVIGVGGGMSRQEAQQLFEDPQMAAVVAGLKHPGALVAKDKRRRARPIPSKGYLLDAEKNPQEIYEIAAAASWLRPGVEDDLAAVLGGVYAQRWSMERAGHLHPGAARPAATAVVEDRPGTGPVPPMTTTGKALLGLPVVGPPPGAKPTFTTGQGKAIPRPFNPEDYESEFARLAEQLPDPAAPASGARLRMLGILFEAGPAGIGTTDLTERLKSEGHTCVRQTVHAWLADEVRAGNAAARGAAPNTKYVHKEFA
jgi:hypothetical protein